MQHLREFRLDITDSYWKRSGMWVTERSIHPVIAENSERGAIITVTATLGTSIDGASSGPYIEIEEEMSWLVSLAR